jgi:hypothetical protein
VCSSDLYRDNLVANLRDNGAVDTELGARWGRPGVVGLWPRFWNEYLVALVPSPPRRALAVRLSLGNGPRVFQTTGVWY